VNGDGNNLVDTSWLSDSDFWRSRSSFSRFSSSSVRPARLGEEPAADQRFGKLPKSQKMELFLIEFFNEKVFANTPTNN
jgi:hypothetical protein